MTPDVNFILAHGQLESLMIVLRRTLWHLGLAVEQATVSSLSSLDAEEHLNLFNSVCSNVLNAVAPIRVKMRNVIMFQNYGLMIIFVHSDRPVEVLNAGGVRTDYMFLMKFPCCISPSC